MPASLTPKCLNQKALSCIATQAPGHFAQGWELPYSCLFRAVPGTVTAPHCACHMQRPHFCAACNSNTPGDSVKGATAPSLGKVAEVASGMAGVDCRRCDPRRPEYHQVCVAGQALRPTSQCNGLYSTSSAREHSKKGSQGLQGPWATRLCNMRCILV